MNMDLGKEWLCEADTYCTERDMAWEHATYIIVKNNHVPI